MQALALEQNSMDGDTEMSALATASSGTRAAVGELLPVRQERHIAVHCFSELAVPQLPSKEPK